MRRGVFAFAFIVGLAASLSGAAAQYSGIGGDLRWPDVPIIDDNTVYEEEEEQQRQAPAPRANRARREQSAPSLGTDAQQPVRTAPAITGSTRPQRSQAAQQSDDSEDGAPARRAEAANGGAVSSLAVPPVPERREAAAPPPQHTVPTSASLAHTVPPEPQDDGLGKLIGQMLIVGFEGTAPDDDWPRRITAQLEKGTIGGVLVLSRNIQSPEQLGALTKAIRSTKEAPAPFLAIDQRGGLGQMLPADRGFQTYPSAAELGGSNDPLSAYAVYQRMAQDLAGRGFNVNLGPVLDLAPEGANAASAEAQHSYGSQPKHVAAFAKAFRLAHHAEGMLTAVKSFPGQVQDGEGGSAARIAAALEPYRQLAIGAPTDVVVVGHQSHPELSDAPGLPASLSEKAIQKTLREQMGFQGLVMSEDLQAPSLSERFPLEESVVRAIRAGADLLLLGNTHQPSPDLPDRIATIIREAVMTGALSRERLQLSHDRIVAAKKSLSSGLREVASAKQGDADEGP